ncbi:MAG: Clp protease N-terminal domain-containing protein, partial [Clostridia bacterium]|nr:Clp protease N-terminal domain-containing protein [Clostridia bacterium]
MYVFNGFTKKASQAMNLAIESAQDFGHNYIGSEHIILGLVKEGSATAYKVLNSLGVTADKLSKLIEEKIGKGFSTKLGVEAFTPRTKRIIQMAKTISANLGSSYIGTEHILLAILEDGESYAVRFLRMLGVDGKQISTELAKILNNAGFTEQEGNPQIKSKIRQKQF